MPMKTDVYQLLYGSFSCLHSSRFLPERKKLWKWEAAISRIQCQTPEKADTKEVMEAVPQEQVATS